MPGKNRAIAFRAAPSLAAFVALVSLSAAPALGQGAPSTEAKGGLQKPEWLQGSGLDLRIRVRGEVVDETGRSVDGSRLSATVRTEFSSSRLPVVIDGSRFHVWVPVGEAGWFNLALSAKSPDGSRVAWEAIPRYRLREAATDGLKLTIKPPERVVEVTVVDGGKPVAGANVTAEVDATPFTATTDEKGIARLPFNDRDKLSQLTAWTDDFRIGGYSFHRDPPRNPSENRYTIELEKCRPQVIRVLDDADKSPVRNLRFVLTVGTGPPNHQFPGQTPESEMRTDDKGEAIYRWFPDWKTHGSYVEIPDPHWVKAAKEETVDGIVVVRVKKSRFEARKQVGGRVTASAGSPGGYAVEMWSFQGEEKTTMDVRQAFTDENGNFEADYLPGATYSIYVSDARHVSDFVAVTAYDPLTDKTTMPSLTVSEGQPVEISVTAGPEKTPVANQGVHLKSLHEYSWQEDGETRHGSGGRQWWVTTDETGMARTFALPGRPLHGTIFDPGWRKEIKTEVKAEEVTRLEFHREVTAGRKITGRLLGLRDGTADLSEAVVEFGSLDGETDEQTTVKTNDKGEFVFESQATKIGIYARTRDTKAAAVAIFDRLDQPLELKLQPTAEVRGRLLGESDRPQAKHAIRALLNVSGERPPAGGPPPIFEAATFETTTDSEGNYVLSGLPAEVVLDLIAGPGRDPESSEDLESIYLAPSETRTRMISRLSTPAPKKSFAQRYDSVLRDCRLSHFGGMVILFRPDERTKGFVDANLLNDETTREVMAFMQIQGQVTDDSSGAEVREFARTKKWPLPASGKVFALAMDPAGKELGRLEIDAADPAAPKVAADFIRQHAPPPVDAQRKWDEAFAAAKASNRKVWARIGQRYCGPCFLLTRWLDEQKALLEQDFVFLKIDDLLDLHGAEVAARLPGQERQGIPFHVIFDPDGTVSITSESPVGNIGFPSGFEGKKHLRKMLIQTRNRLTDRQIDGIIESLTD